MVKTLLTNKIIKVSFSTICASFLNLTNSIFFLFTFLNMSFLNVIDMVLLGITFITFLFVAIFGLRIIPHHKIFMLMDNQT